MRPIRGGDGSSRMLRLVPVLLACVTAVLPPATHGQEPVRVAVHFEFSDPKYRDAFGSGVGAAEARMSKLVAEYLATRIGFVRFVPDGTEDFELRFVLDRRDRTTTSSFIDRVVFVSLEPVNRDGRAWFTFRDANASMRPVGTIDEVARELRDLLRIQDLEPVRVLLADVPIAREALPLPTDNPKGWALPFTQDALCMHRESLLKVMNEEPMAPVTRTLPYEARVTGLVNRPPLPADPRYHQGLFSEPLTAVRRGVVKEVYVTDYRQLPECHAQLAQPRTTPAGGGSQ